MKSTLLRRFVYRWVIIDSAWVEVPILCAHCDNPIGDWEAGVFEGYCSTCYLYQPSIGV